MRQSRETARRAYWTRTMEEADGFMREITLYPVRECGESAASLEEAASAEGVEVEFSRLPHVNGLERMYLMREGLIDNFLSAAREMNSLGWILKVEDAYRTAEMQRLGLQKHIFMPIIRKVRWECGCGNPPAELLHRRFGALVATSPKAGTHMSASAVDISVVRRDTGEEVDRGASYLEMSELTPMDSPFIPERAAENRGKITRLLGKHGFAAYPFEFWHYSAGDAFAGHIGGSGGPARYGPVNIGPGGRVSPVDNPLETLVSGDEFERLVKEAPG